jgi:hypothetical protein
MAESPLNDRRTKIVAMKEIIGQLDELLTVLQEMGGEMPVIEKNVRAMKSFVAVLQYGISDLAEVLKQE